MTEEFEIINIERDSQNGDDIYMHIKDSNGYDYKGVITGTEISVAEQGLRKEMWICKACGKSTYETEYDYLAARDMHLECALKKEMAHLKISSDKEEEIYCFCGYERDDKSKEGLDDWDKHIKECPNYHYKMKEEEKLSPSFDKNIDW